MAKVSRPRGTRPWGGLAKELTKIGVEPNDAEEQSWLLWFEHRCPKTSAILEKLDDKGEGCLKELYEQTSGKFVDNEDEEEEEEEDSNDNQRPGVSKEEG